ncbi:MAG: serine hydrolase [Thermodesulfobacteriota bacterium]
MITPWRPGLALLDDLLAEGVRQGVFPGGAYGVGQGPPAARRIWQGAAGCACLAPVPLPLMPAALFDLASLTKPLATTLLLAQAVGRRQLDLDTPLAHLLLPPLPADKKAITVRQLLSHCSGLPAHRPYYRELVTQPPAARRRRLLELLLAEPLLAPPGEATLYSDCGFLLLGLLVEAWCGESLDRAVQRLVYQPLGLEAHLGFRPLARDGLLDPAAPGAGGRQLVATSRCPWRGRLLQGEVEDENAHALEGVAGHAGLFGDVAGVVDLALILLDAWQGRGAGAAFFGPGLAPFFQRGTAPAGSTWALGFDTPSDVGSSAGRFLSRRSAGHLGFTGTSFWIDPDQDLVVVLLTNRVHPRRDNPAIRAFRPRFHEALEAALARTAEGPATAALAGGRP